MVVIVNAARTVDKLDFFHMLKGLRVAEAAEQALYPDGTKTGQKTGGVQEVWFRTFDPVDIHGFIHKARRFQVS